MKVKYEDLKFLLEERFPQLRSRIACFYDDWCDVSFTYGFYNDVLNPYVKDLLREGTDQKALETVFSFYEELAESDDEEVRNFLQVELLEALWDDYGIYTNACACMLPKTKRINAEIGAYFTIPKG